MKSIACTMALVTCCGWIAQGQLAETNHIIKSTVTQPAPVLNNPSQALTNVFLFSATLNEDTPQVPLAIRNPIAGTNQQSLAVQTRRGNANRRRQIILTNQPGNALVFGLPLKSSTNLQTLGNVPPSLKPGNYQTEPYSMIVKVPGKHPDEKMASSAPEIASTPEAPMPVIKPELRFIPRK